jgi:hypothetical protein
LRVRLLAPRPILRFLLDALLPEANVCRAAGSDQVGL